MAAREARRLTLSIVRLLRHALRRFLTGLGRSAAGAAQVVRHLVRRDGEQVSLQLTALVEVGQGIEEADKRFLDDVLGGTAVADATDGKGEQSALIEVNEPLPGVRVTLADLLDEQP